MLLIRWHGHSCFEITNDVTIVTDPHDGRSIGIPTPSVTGDIILVSHNHYDHNSVKTVEKDGSKVITDERKRTVEKVTISGVPAYHDEEQGAHRGKMILFKFICDDITFCHLGDLGHELDEKTIQQIGEVDILFVPIGGTYTIDAEQAWHVIDRVKPKIAIPMHYRIEGLSLPITGVDPFLEKNHYKILKVGNEIDIEKDELPKEPEIWVFTL
ncbi:MAG: MBL fold metallo-hydrolase [Candidatus Thermoplasmatota archaeon]|nr:MBL fold metallo-hydrolase [Candidatus Thermoplasmatota archaeon]